MLRTVVPALCVLVLVAAFATGSDGASSQRAADHGTYATWPASLAVPAAAASPAELGSEVQGRVVAAFRSMDALWRGAFARDGRRWVTPQLRFTDNLQRPCAGALPVYFAGMYCPSEATIYINLNGLYADAVTQDGALYVLAHEFGHHVQALRGAFGAKPLPSLELDAQCLAGVWGRATGRPAPNVDSYPEDDGVHGSPALQREWLERGYARARPADCDGVLR